MKNRTSTENQSIRSGFTLVELMLVIAIIGVLTTMVLGLMQSATSDAKEAATKARIRQIQEMILVEMEDYEVRRFPMSVNELLAYAAVNPVRTDSGGNPVGLLAQVRNLRRRIVQDLINSEMPRPIFDDSTPSNDFNDYFFANGDIGTFPSNTPGVGTGSLGFRDWLDQEYPNGTPLLSARLASLKSSRIESFARLNGNVNFNLPGEFLYQILDRIDFDGESGVEILGGRAVGDTDSDGFFEVLDGWNDSLQLRFFQIALDPATQPKPTPSNDTPAAADVYVDYPNPDFDIVVPSAGVNPVFLLPVGYGVMDPTIPRELGKIRFDVVSPNMGRQSGDL